LIGTLSLAWIVEPPGSRVPAIPLIAIAKAISPLPLTRAIAVLTTNVFPVPPAIRK
jgi:hypothetical protein